MSCYFYYVLLPRGPEFVVSVDVILCVALLMDLFVLCVSCLTGFVNCLL